MDILILISTLQYYTTYSCILFITHFLIISYIPYHLYIFKYSTTPQRNNKGHKYKHNSTKRKVQLPNDHDNPLFFWKFIVVLVLNNNVKLLSCAPNDIWRPHMIFDGIWIFLWMSLNNPSPDCNNPLSVTQTSQVFSWWCFTRNRIIFFIQIGRWIHWLLATGLRHGQTWVRQSVKFSDRVLG